MEVRDGIGAHVMCSHLYLFPDLSEHGVSKAADPRRGLSLGPSRASYPRSSGLKSQWGWVKAVGRPQTLFMLVQASSGGGGSTKAVAGARGLASGEDELGTCGTRRG